MRSGGLPRAFIVLALVGVVASCQGDGPKNAIVVTMYGDDTVPPLVQLRATFASEARMDARVFPSTRATSALALPTSFSVSVPDTVRGVLYIAVEGFDDAGTVAASGWTQATIVPGRVVETVGVLAPSAPPGPDAGAPDEGAQPDTDDMPGADPTDANPTPDGGLLDMTFGGDQDAAVP
jgi:hypothetical protein